MWSIIGYLSFKCGQVRHSNFHVIASSKSRMGDTPDTEVARPSTAQGSTVRRTYRTYSDTLLLAVS